MKKKILILTLAAALGAGGLFAIKAHAENAGPRRSRGALLQKAREHLGITDAQAAQIRDVLKGERETLANLARELHAAHAGLRDTIQKDGSTEADVRAASAKLAKVQADMAVERHKLFGTIKPILTPEQLERLAKMQDKLDDFVDGAISRIEERLGE
jgi:Spy/CpxP family protein refolding chaperone